MYMAVCYRLCATARHSAAAPRTAMSPLVLLFARGRANLLLLRPGSRPLLLLLLVVYGRRSLRNLCCRHIWCGAGCLGGPDPRATLMHREELGVPHGPDSRRFPAMSISAAPQKVSSTSWDGTPCALRGLR